MSNVKVTPSHSARRGLYHDVTQEVTAPAPTMKQPPGKMPMLAKIFMVGLPLFMVSMMIVMFASGQRQMNMMYMGMMMMMMVSMVGGRFMQQNGGSADLDTSRRDMALQLNMQRKNAHVNGAVQHDAAVINFPHPEAIPTLVEKEYPAMWSVNTLDDGDLPEAGTGSMTANPYLTGRVGTGLALTSTPVRSEAEQTLLPEQLEEVTNYMSTNFIAIHNLVPNCPLGIPVSVPALGFRGSQPHIYDLVRTLVISLAYSHNPRNLHIGVVTDRPQQWDWLKWLPSTINITSPDHDTHFYWGSMREACRDLGTMQDYLNRANSHMVVVVDLPDHAVYVPDDITRGVVEHEGLRIMNSTTFLVAGATDDKKITQPSHRIHVSDTGDVSVPGGINMAHADNTSIEVAENVARALSRFRPEGFGTMPSGDGDEVEVSADMPDMIETLIGRGVDLETYSFSDKWKETDKEQVSFKAPLAAEVNKHNQPTGRVIYWDMAQVNSGGTGPHGGFSGGTGTGKSYLLMGIILMLCCTFSPKRLRIIAADFKGAATFSALRHLPHFAAVLSNLGESADEVSRLEAAVEGEYLRRQNLFISLGVEDVFEYRKLQKSHPEWEDLPAILIVIDEFREFVEKDRHWVKVFEHWGAVLRAYDMHLLLGSQYLDTAVLGDTAQHMHYGFSLKVTNAQHSNIVLRSPEAVNLPSARTALFRSTDLQDTKWDRVTSFVHSEPYVPLTGGVDVIDHVDDDGTVTKATGTVRPFALTNFADRSEKEKAVANREPEKAKAAATGEDKFAALIRRVLATTKGYTKPRSLWATSLSVPMTLADIPTEQWAREQGGPVIRIGDVDMPLQHARVPYNIDLSHPATASVFIQGALGRGSSTTLQTVVTSAAASYAGNFLSFFIYDYNGTSLSPLKDMPNVSMYATRLDVDTWRRMRGELYRIRDIRERAFANHGYTSMEQYFARRAADGVTGDQYGYIGFVVDGIDAMFADSSQDFDLVDEMTKWPKLSQFGISPIFSATTTPTGKFRSTMGQLAQHVRLRMNDTPDYITPLGIDGKKIWQEMPGKQPGRFITDDFTDDLGNPVWHHGIIMAPLNRPFEPISEVNGVKTFNTQGTDLAPEIKQLAAALSKSQPAETHAPHVAPVSRNIAFTEVWETFSRTPFRQLEPRNRPVPLGIDTGTGLLRVLNPLHRENHLLVLGDSGSGISTTLASHMNAVANANQPGTEAIMMVIDAGTALYPTAKRMIKQGFMKPSMYFPAFNDDAREAIAKMTAHMENHRPSMEQLDQREARPWYTGPEVYIYIDRAHLGLDGSPADPSSLAGLVEPLKQGFDLGVHIISGMSAATYATQRVTNKFIKTMTEELSSPVLALSAGSGLGPFMDRHRFEELPQGRGKLVKSGSSAEAIIQVGKSTL